MAGVIDDLRSFVLHPEVSSIFALRLDDAVIILAELDRLRAVAGAVTPGPDAAEVLKPLRHRADG